MSTFYKVVFFLFILLIGVSAGACFGPKLYVGTAAGEDGELLFHLVAIYVKEKTGVESLRVELTSGQTAEDLLQQKKIDLGFYSSASEKWPHLLRVGRELFLLHGPRPTDDLQFTTVPKALLRLQKNLQPADLQTLRQQVSVGVLPAKAVRTFYLQRGWI